MAIRRVIAHFMHEVERDAAEREMPGSASTDAYVIGEIDDNRIAALEAQGLIVESLGDMTQTPATPERDRIHGAETVAGRMRAGGPSTGGLLRPDDFPPPDLSKPQYYFVWLKGPLLEVWRGALEKEGIQPTEVFPTGAYKVLLDSKQLQVLNGLPFVRAVSLYDASDTGPDLLSPFQEVSAAVLGDETNRKMLCFDILVHAMSDSTTIRDWLKQHSVAVAGASGRKIRVFLHEDAPEIRAIPALVGVERFEEYLPPELHNDRARVLLHIDQNPPGVSLTQTGAGQIVAIADTGLDDQHPDFQGRIVGVVALGRPGNSSDPHGHGTHVAGSVLGDGSASGGALRGTAPKASLFFQSLLDSSGKLGGLPLDLATLFDEAYLKGARIHNNSWGSATASRYVISSQEVDAYVAKKRDMLVVISAGNEGIAKGNANAAPGFVDWLSIGSPASCKNALTVGASRSDRQSGGYSTLTYGSAWPADFPDAPIASENVSGNAECMAAFSSRGPCDDRRIKPDVVAPGTDIASCKSRLAPLSHFWGSYPGNPQYSFMGGTSMAAPLVSGCAALIREFYAQNGNASPSAALIKATLINGTRWLNGSDAGAPANGFPNFHQGFGAVSLVDTIPNPARPGLLLKYVDADQAGPMAFTQTGQRVRFQFSVTGHASMLRICLAYTDLEARALQNNLNLFLQLPDSSKKLGNAQLPNSLNIPDPDNNVEVIRITSPAQGNYLIQITATNLLRQPQDFALVVTGENISNLVRM